MTYQNKFFVLFLLLFVSAHVYAQNDADKPIKFKDQVILDDLIVDGSICVGFDCVNGENFGFKTLRLKENNLRIHFDDTSTSASFPSSDWCIQINDTSNGGANYYGVVHENTGRRVFTLEANAPSNSLYVEDDGDVGFGTATPVVNLHVVDGDTPTLRLEQNGSSGFTPQTWDLAGNETNFFLRDVTNGSKLPFRVRPNTPTSAIETDADVVTINDDGVNLDFRVEGDTEQNLIYADASSGFVGMGTNAPNARLIISGTTNATAEIATDLTGGSASNSGLRLRRDGTTQAGLFVNASNDLLFFSGGNVERGSFEANGNFLVDGNIVASSDRRLKSNIVSYDRGLEEVLKLNPIEYNYNGKAGVAYKESKIGLVAQELQEVAPEMVSNIDKGTYDSDGNFKSQGTFLGIHENEVKYLLINAIKDQQEIIDNQELRMDDLQQENIELREMIVSLQEAFEGLNIENAKLDGTEGAFLKQNVPNPFNGQTQISYSIPEFSSTASLKVFNVTGTLLREVPITNNGQGIITLDATDLSQGTYTYTLFVDGKIIATEQMVLAK